jgi:tyrosyl-tRNA synthetase
MLPAKEQLDILRRATAEIIPEEELVRRLEEGRPLRVKWGVDPTGPDIHLGHAVVLRELRQFQDLGHIAVLIVGDFTGLIGDPSGRTESRPQLTREQVRENMRHYRRQAFMVLDRERTEFRYNSKWLGKLSSSDILRLCGSTTVAQILVREGYAERYAAGEPIGLHELLYPLFQAYDSIAVRADVELGGTEQKFNLLVGRELQRTNPLGDPQPQQVCITMPILIGTDGQQRMGKSLGNYIPVGTTAEDLYGKIMSIPDSLIGQYRWLLTDTPESAVKALEEDIAARRVNPRDVKSALARDIVAWLGGKQAAARAEKAFQRIFAGKAPDREALLRAAKHVSLPGGRMWISTLLVQVGLVGSASEARRVISQAGVWVEDQNITDPQQEVEVREGMLVRVGKRRAAVIHLTGG